MPFSNKTDEHLYIESIKKRGGEKRPRFEILKLVFLNQFFARIDKRVRALFCSDARSLLSHGLCFILFYFTLDKGAGLRK